jgi:mono/diheme cytochrome c family protein
MRLLRQLFGVGVVVAVLGAIILLFTYDVMKLEWVSFMEIQPSYDQMDNPLPVPARSIPIEGAVAIPGMGAPENPMPGDEASIIRGRELFAIHCQMCHGETGQGTGPIAAFLIRYKPANLTSDVAQSKSDGSIFLTISNGLEGRMPPLNENLTVSERWDVVNYVRTLHVSQED